MNVLEWVWHD